MTGTTTPAAMSGARGRALVASIVLAALGYLAFAIWGGWRDVAHALAQVGVAGVLVALALSLVNYGARFVRWQMYLGALGHRVPWGPSLRIYVGGFALTTTPGKAGEAVRGVLLKPWGVPYPHSLAAFLSERLSDLIAVLLLTLFGLGVRPDAWPLVLVGVGGALAFFVVIGNPRLLGALRVWLTPARIQGRLRGLLVGAVEILIQARRCNAPALLVWATLLSVVGWAAEAWAFELLLRWIGQDTGFGFAAFVYALSMLAGALSMLPGGLGSAEGVMVGLLVWRGVPTADAVAVTVLIRLATLWFAIALGAVTLPGAGRPRPSDA